MAVKGRIDAPTAAALVSVYDLMGLADAGAVLSPETLATAAEGLLRASDADWHAVAACRADPDAVNACSGEWGHPVFLRLFSMEPRVWESIERMRPAWAKLASQTNSPIRRLVLDAVRIALTPEEGQRSTPASSIESPRRRSPEESARAERETFVRNYQRLRPAHLNTQGKVAKAAGVSLGTIIAIERHRVRPQFRTVSKLAAAFGVEPEDLLG